ncbi:MAG: theronine dehydrogenase-like Zn-dependent dehydrogenase [Actinomycetia bacterium]|nr:theronine dehydrogenase-like Zn-dependent dehydrogenase [Actinomycetes bacterium]
MRTVVAKSGALRVAELPALEPEAGQVLVRVRSCGICGSDLHSLRHAESVVAMSDAIGSERNFDPDADYMMGHEYCGEVLALGPATESAVGPGDLTVAMPFLIRGATVEAIGFSNRIVGGYAEEMILDAGLCLKVPNGLDAGLASLTEPLAVGLHAVNRSGIERGDAALVLGCGPIGLSLVVWLKARGIGPIVVSDYSPRRRGLAAELGADVVVDPREERPVDAWKRIDGVRPLVVFEAVGVPGMIDEAMRSAPSKARILVVGVCMERDAITPMIGVIKELDMKFAVYYEADEFADTLHAIAEGLIDVAPLVTGRVGLDGVAGAFTALGDPEGQVKVLVDPALTGTEIQPVR